MELKKKNWNQITISDYMSFLDISKREDAVDVEIGIVALLCDCDEEEILALPIPEYQRLRRHAQFMGKFPEISGKSPKSITIGDFKYDVITDMTKLTTAQYIDFQTYLKMDIEKFLPNMLSIFIVPKGCKYGDDDYNIDDLANDIKEHLPIITAFEMCSFFQIAFLSLIKGTLTSLESKMKKGLRKAKTEEEKKMMMEIVKKLETLTKINGVG